MSHTVPRPAEERALPPLHAPCARYAQPNGPTRFNPDTSGPRVRWYVRVSTPQQAREETHEAQVHVAQERALAEGWADLVLYVEPGVSGETLEERPVMQRLLADVEADPGDIVAVKALDRLCRSQSLAPWSVIAETLKRANVAVVAQGLHLDLRDSMHALMFTFLGPGFAGFEKSMIVSRFRDGRARAARAGRKPGAHTPWPLHYDLATKTWSLPDGRREAARKMVDLALEGRSHARVAEILNDLGYRTSRGYPWTDKSVRKILHSRDGHCVLAGEWWIPSMKLAIPVPSVCSQEEIERIWALATSRESARPGRPPQSPALFQGRAWCGTCQSRLYVVRGGTGRGRQYRCVSTTEKGLKRGLTPCGTPGVPVDEAEDAAWRLIVQMLDDPGLLREALTDDRAGTADAALQDEAEQLRAVLSRLDSGRRTLLRNIGLGLIEAHEADEALRHQEAKRTEVQSRLQEIEGHLAGASRAAERALGLQDEIERLRGGLATCTVEERRAIIEAVCPSPTEHGLFLAPGRRLVVRGALGLAGLTGAEPRAAESPPSTRGGGGGMRTTTTARRGNRPPPQAGR